MQEGRKEENGAASAAAGLHRSSSNCHASTQKDDKGTIRMGRLQKYWAPPPTVGMHPHTVSL